MFATSPLFMKPHYRCPTLSRIPSPKLTPRISQFVVERIFICSVAATTTHRLGVNRLFLCGSSSSDHSSTVSQSMTDRPLVNLQDAIDNPTQLLSAIPNSPGVYAIYDSKNILQYIGISRKVATSVAAHVEDLPELACGVKVLEIPGGNKEILQEAWKGWMQDAVADLGSVPSGNKPGERLWLVRKRKPVKPELKLTPGKGIEDLTVSIESLLETMIQEVKVLAFIKGTRTGPECSFSHNLLVMLNECGVEYELVNVMDEKHNPGVREAIKIISDWPTTPQLYYKGEFLGGAEIVEEMFNSGELKEKLSS